MSNKLDVLILELSREFRLFGRTSGAGLAAASLAQLFSEGDVQLSAICFVLAAQLSISFVALGLCLRMLVDDEEAQ